MSYAKERVEGNTQSKSRKYNHDHKAANDWINSKYNDLHFLRRDDILRKIRAFSEAYYLKAGGSKEDFENLFDNQKTRCHD